MFYGFRTAITSIITHFLISWLNFEITLLLGTHLDAQIENFTYFIPNEFAYDKNGIRFKSQTNRSRTLYKWQILKLNFRKLLRLCINLVD